ncbi:MAG TPA: DUF4199 domain-containing protein [Mucilaginibacter sp.]|jgi:ABC-type sugar transport system permease subunit
MKKTIIICGLIAGLIATAWTIAGMAGLHIEGSLLLGYSTMLVAFSLIFVAVKNSRDKFNGGFISFGKALQIGLLITLIASTIYVAAWLISYYYMNSDYLDKYAAHVLAKMKTDGASAAELQKKTTELQNFREMYQNPFFNAMMTYLEILPMGIVISLIAAFILKRKSDSKNVVTTAV